MSVDTAPLMQFQAGQMKVEVYQSADAAGRAAASTAVIALKGLATARDVIPVIFATGASQFEMLSALTSIEHLSWEHVQGFHMDEYIGLLAADHPASFRRYLRERPVSKVEFGKFHEIDGGTPDPQRTAHEYAQILRAANPQLCPLGIGENGHLAFNDPPVADFNDSLDAEIVRLDAQCRQQQLAEGWFPSSDDVPDSAITLTIPALVGVPKLIASVPGPRKAAIVRRTLTEPISTACPATILRTHPDVTVFLDAESASQVTGQKMETGS